MPSAKVAIAAASNGQRREMHQASLANLEAKRWRPGQSGNPTGKSKRFDEMHALAKDHSLRGLERIIELVDSDDERIALMAAKEVLDRAYGKPKIAEGDDADPQLVVNVVKFSGQNGRLS